MVPDARERLGLPVQGALTPPLIRSVGAQGDTPRPFTTSEVNALLAKVAKPGEPAHQSAPQGHLPQLGSQSGSFSSSAKAVGLPCGCHRIVSEHLFSRSSGTAFEGIGPGLVFDSFGDSEERLLCGRANTDRFVSVGQLVHQPFPRCEQCFHDEC